MWGLEYFTPISGFFGGGLIGLSAGLLLLFSGEILGSSGISSSIVLEPKKHMTEPYHAWKLVFLATFLLFSNVCLAKYFTNDERLGTDPSIPIVSKWGYLLGGLFVGFGTRLSNGCTTGHGICGMARLSKRSIVAVCTFMGSAFATSAVISPDNKTFAAGTAWLRTDTVPVFFNRWLGFGCCILFVIPACIALYHLFKKEQRRRSSMILLEKRASVRFPKMALAELAAELEKEDSEMITSRGQDYGSTNKSADEKPALDDDEESQHSSKDEDTTKDAQDEPPKSEEKEEHSSASTEESSSQKGPEDDEQKSWEEMRELYQAARQKLADGKIAPAALAACLFSLGLAVSQMVLPSKVLGFLALYTFANGSFDPTLLTVMIGGALVSFLSYQFVEGWGLIKNPWARKCPFSSSEFCVPTNTTIDWKLLFGAFCFGVGWALAGLCPGPATFLAASGTKPVLFCWWPMYFVGAFTAQKLKEA